ncbi:hypothetical protein CQA88_32225, partial [Klebsiella pneumoniae]
LQQEMLRIHRLLGRTIVLVTRDIDEALRLADHLVLQQEMLRIHRLLGRTIVLVTRDIDEALRLADHL